MLSLIFLPVFPSHYKQVNSKIIKKIVEKIAQYEYKPLKIEGFIESAVLIPLIEDKESILFIKRSSNVKDHKGQIAFPGGVISESDSSPIETALRETEEEVGVKPENIEPINFIDDTITIAGYLIHPVVGLVRGNPEIFPNPDEVDQIFIVPIKDILSSEIREDPDRLSWEFHVNGITIWGATARILKNLLDISGLI
ncbi:MAG: CoA pyrophosphatase [Candidatus Calescibacterium sp.]|nr:CoA pyrophosphatase [Candidatus Calescibacterium sp.]MDW8087547.1 CoA pyrophosphatase [Candidatus Calescibacterium sp.]